MKLVSPLLKHVVYPGLARAGYLRRFARNGPAVVTFHGVLPEGYRTIDSGLDGSLVSTSSLRLQIRLLQGNTRSFHQSNSASGLKENGSCRRGRYC